MTPRQKYRATVVLTVGSAVLGVAGTAQAYLKSAGSGSGSASTGTVSLLTDGTASATGTQLHPGASGDLTFKVHNPNSRAVVITGATAGTPTGCTTPAVTITVPANFSTTVAAGSDQTVTWTGAAVMGLTASNNCQGQTITVPLSLSGKLS